MRRRMLMDLIFGGDDVIKYGYFDVKPEIEKESWQVNTDDFTIEAQTTLDAVPKKLICVYIDDKEQIKNANVSMFIGRLSGNGTSGTGNNNNTQTMSESTSFISPDATYLRFDEPTKKIYMHLPIWRNIKCGKWMWIAIYNE